MKKTLGILFYLSVSVSAATPIEPPSTHDKLIALDNKIQYLKKEISTQQEEESKTRQQCTKNKKNLDQVQSSLQHLKQDTINKQKTLRALTNNIYLLMNQKEKHQQALATLIRLKFEDAQQHKRMTHPYFYDCYVKAQTKEICALMRKLHTYQVSLQTVEQERIALDIIETQLVKQTRQLKKEQQLSQQILPQYQEVQSSKKSELDALISEKKQLESLLKKLSTKITFIEEPQQGDSLKLPFARSAGKLPLPIHHNDARLIKNKHNKFIIQTLPNALVYPVYPGRIIFAQWLRGLGQLIIIDHGKGYMSLYGNNQMLYKKTGDWVNEQEPIAQLEKSELYFEIRKNGQAINLNKWIQKK